MLLNYEKDLDNADEIDLDNVVEKDIWTGRLVEEGRFIEGHLMEVIFNFT